MKRKKNQTPTAFRSHPRRPQRVCGGVVVDVDDVVVVAVVVVVVVVAVVVVVVVDADDVVDVDDNVVVVVVVVVGVVDVVIVVVLHGSSCPLHPVVAIVVHSPCSWIDPSAVAFCLPERSFVLCRRSFFEARASDHSGQPLSVHSL